MLTFTNTLVIVHHRAATIMSTRVKALAATESQGRAAGPVGMLRKASESVNQADTKVYKFDFSDKIYGK